MPSIEVIEVTRGRKCHKCSTSVSSGKHILLVSGGFGRNRYYINICEDCLANLYNIIKIEKEKKIEQK